MATEPCGEGFCNNLFFCGGGTHIEMDHGNAPPRGVFFVNGIRTNVCQCRGSARNIYDIANHAIRQYQQIDPETCLYGVACSHNDTFLDEEVQNLIMRNCLISIAVGCGITGAGLIGGKNIGRAFLVGVITTLITFCVLNTLRAPSISEKEEAVANSLVGRVRRYLDVGAQRIAVIVAHSHGSVITNLAFSELSKIQGYRGRIRIITLGGAITIKHKAGYEINNIADENDPYAGCLEFRESVIYKRVIQGKELDPNIKKEVEAFTAKNQQFHLLDHYLGREDTQQTLALYLA